MGVMVGITPWLLLHILLKLARGLVEVPHYRDRKLNKH